MATPQPTRVKSAGNTRQAITDFFDAERRNGERIQKFNLGLTEDDELPPYEHQDYPKAMFAIDGETALANDLREEQKFMQEGFYPTLEQALNAADEQREDQAFAYNLREEQGFASESEQPAKAAPPKRSHSKKAR